MKPVIVEFVKYLQCGSTTDKIKLREREFGVVDLRVSAINLFEWLQSHTEKKKPEFKLSGLYKWHSKLRLLIGSDMQLSKLFVVKDKKVFFRDEVSNAERVAIVNYIKENYHPKIRT